MSPILPLKPLPLLWAWWKALISLLRLVSCLTARDRRLAASLAPWSRCPILVNRQEAWALTDTVLMILLNWDNVSPTSASEGGCPLDLAWYVTLASASWYRSWWRCWLPSPNWPTTRHCSSPHDSNLCPNGPTCPCWVPLYFISLAASLALYSLGKALALLSTALSLHPLGYLVGPALITFSSAISPY